MLCKIFQMLQFPLAFFDMVMKKNQGRFLGYIISRATPTLFPSLLYSTIDYFCGN